MDAIAKHIITVEGEVKPLVATRKQWEQISSELKKGSLPIHTNGESYEIYAVLEIAKGYEGTGISNSKDGVLLLFGKVVNDGQTIRD